MLTRSGRRLDETEATWLGEKANGIVTGVGGLLIARLIPQDFERLMEYGYKNEYYYGYSAARTILGK